jgi:Protein of unknown function (DUF3592)
MTTNSIRAFQRVLTPGWQTVEATVNACRWVVSHDNFGEPTGHYDVSVAYRVPESDQPRCGTFCYEGSEQILPYRPGDKVTIEYNPRHTSRCRAAGSPPNYEKLEAILVMALFALLAGYVLMRF